MRNFKQIVSIFVLCMAISSISFAEEKLRLTNGEWTPYLSENLKNYGVASHIVTEAFVLEGITVEYSFFPWKRSYEVAKQGKWDGSVLWTANEERKETFIFSDAVMNDTVVFFHLKSTSFKWEKIEDLKGIKIGTTLGYSYGDEFDKAAKDGLITAETCPTDEQNFKKLLVKRMPVFVCNIDVGYNIINTIFDKTTAPLFTHHPKPIKDAALSLILTKAIPENEAKMGKFNSGLKKLKESGKYDQMIKDSREGKYNK